MRRHWLQQGRRRCASGIPAQQGPQLPHAHIAHCPAEEAGGEAQARPSAQASAAVSQPSHICLKDIEVSRGCDLSCMPVFWKAGNFGWGRQVQPPCSWECMVCLPAWQVSDGCGSGVVVTPEQVCRELKPGRQEALPCLCCPEIKVVLEQTEPERLSVTNITKNQGRGGVIWSCPSLLLKLNLCSVHQSTCTSLPCRSAAAVKS